jgi:hypothetical protein
MTRTFLLHLMTTIAALALLSLSASSPVSAQKANPIIWLSYDQAVEPGQSKTTKGLTTKKGPKASVDNFQTENIYLGWQDW